MLHLATRRRQALTGLAFAAPFVIGFAVFYLYPILASAYYSFTDFNLFQSPEFVGLDNYQRMAGDQSFWKALANTAYLTVVGVPLSIILGVVGAHFLNFPVRGQPLYRAFAYLPTIIPVVVGGYVWRWMFNAQYGFVNHVLGWFGIDGPAWLEDAMWTKPAILIMTLWTIGGTMIIYLAALKDVPQELYEAAELDGAGMLKRFWHITWPVISPVTLFQFIVNLIAYLQIFAQPYLLSQDRLNNAGSGPGQSMLTYAMYLFQNAFSFLNMGYASAMAWLLFLITVVVTLIVLATSKKWVHYGLR